MREIKFRAHCKPDNRFYYFTIGQGVAVFNDRDIYNQLCLDGVAFEQFIRLHDKNGNEIYEGDILSQGISRFIVKWDDKHAMYKCFFVGLDEHYCNLSDDYIRDYFSVIGNIHENPELLEGKE